MRWNHQEEQKLEIIHILKYCSGFAVFGGSNITWFSCFGPHSSPLQWDVNNLSGKANISRTSHAWAYKSSIRLNQEAADALIHANPGPRGIPLWSVPRLSSTSRPSPRCGWYPGKETLMHNGLRWGSCAPIPCSRAGRWELWHPRGRGAGTAAPSSQLPGLGIMCTPSLCRSLLDGVKRTPKGRGVHPQPQQERQQQKASRPLASSVSFSWLLDVFLCLVLPPASVKATVKLLCYCLWCSGKDVWRHRPQRRCFIKQLHQQSGLYRMFPQSNLQIWHSRSANPCRWELERALPRWLLCHPTPLLVFIRLLFVSQKEE